MENEWKRQQVEVGRVVKSYGKSLVRDDDDWHTGDGSKVEKRGFLGTYFGGDDRVC